MVYIDWKTIMSITPETFTEDDKEDLLNTLVWFSPSTDTTFEQLSSLLKVLQEITKHKADQVESLMGALDELASKQGEEVARARQDLLDELDELKEQLEYLRRLEKDDGISDNQLRADVVRLQMQNEELLLELQEREKDIVAEKAETEALVSKVARLERDKADLAHELAACQEEANERRGMNAIDSPDAMSERLDELMQLVRQKNKHIMQLLSDIEIVEESNQSLRIKLKTLQDELTESNKSFIELTEKTAGMKVVAQDLEAKILEMTERNKALEAQVRELLEDKTKHDKELDEFALILNSRVEEWRELMDMKDQEIATLTDELAKQSSRSSQWIDVQADPQLKIRVVKQEEEILSLKSELKDLKRENEKYTRVVESLKCDLEGHRIKKEAYVRLSEYEQQIQDLQERLKLAEDDSIAKAEEITNLIIQIRTYERSEYGLSEAVEQLKKMERRLIEKDARIEDLVAECNKSEIEKSELEDENLYLREKLGLSPSHVINSNIIHNRSKIDAEIKAGLQKEVETLNEDILDLKLRNRELKSQLQQQMQIGNGNKSDEPRKSSDDSEAKKSIDEPHTSEDRYIGVIAENDALRKGIHEILHSIQSSSNGAIEAKSLERLLEALDARHVSGWYHPAMRLQAELNKSHGECCEVRNQLRIVQDDNFALRKQLAEIESKSSMPNIMPQTSSESHKDECDESEKTIKSHMDFEVVLSQRDNEMERRVLEWEKERMLLVRKNEELLSENQLMKSLEKPGNEPGLTYVMDFIKSRKILMESIFEVLNCDYMKKQEDLIVRIGSLQQEKLKLITQLGQMEKLSVTLAPSGSTLESEKQFETLQSKLLTLLGGMSAERSIGTQIDNSYWESEKRSLLNELRAEKEKCHQQEALLNASQCTNATATLKDQLSVLSSKLAASEVRETAEKQRRCHLEKLLEMLKIEHEQSLQREVDLRNQVQYQTQINEKYERSVLDLEKVAIQGKESDIIGEMERKIEAITAEKINMEELLEISRNQCRALQSVSIIRQYEDDSLMECVSILRAGSNEQATIARLGQDLLVKQGIEQRLTDQIAEQQTTISRLVAENLEKEEKISSLLDDLKAAKLHASNHVRTLYKRIRETHSFTDNPMILAFTAKARSIIEELERKQDNLEEIFQSAKHREEEVRTKEEELIVQLESIYDLKAAFHSDSRALVDKHNKSTEIRLKEVRLRRENEYYVKEIDRLENFVRKLNNDIAILDDKCVEKEKEWEEKQKSWEIFQSELCELMDVRGKLSLVEYQSPPSENESVQIMEKLGSLQKEVSTLKEENLRLRETMKKMKMMADAKQEANVRQKTLELNQVTGPEELQTKYKIDGCESERVALKLTINSLQSIIKQKEESLQRYQELLRKNRQEHGNVVRKLQNEMKNVHNALAQQSKAFSRLKYGTLHSGYSAVEEFVLKVQELEEELSESRKSLSRARNQVVSSQQDAEKWREVAEDRLTLLEETKERMETEIEKYEAELSACQSEIQRLRESTDEDERQELLSTIHELEQKLNQPTSETGREIKSNDHQQVDMLKRKLKASQDEVSRLREQVRVLQNIKRRPTSDRTNNKNYSDLVDKIKTLEEMLNLSKQHEKELEEMGLKKIRSVEEVTKWEERKRYERNIEKLQNKLKQKEMETNVATQKLDSFRNLMNKLEKDKGMLEVQLKNMNNSARESVRMERLLAEKAAMAEQVAVLQEEIANLQRHEGGKAAALLHSKLEEQERRIASLQLANQSASSISEEVDQLKSKIRTMQTENGQLQREIIKIGKKWEEVSMENRYLQDKCNELEKGRCANSSAMNHPPSRAQIRMAYDSRREVNKVKADLAATRDELSTMIEKNERLEEELMHLRSQLNLWEEKDMADSLSKSTNQHMVSELHQEMTRIKGELAHKTHLLERVKILLKRAAAKEKSLNEKVASLQSMVAANSPSFQ